MDAVVVIGVDEFEQLRTYEKAFRKMYNSLMECKYADDKCETVYAEQVRKAIDAMLDI